MRTVCGLTDDELGMSVSEWLNANGFAEKEPDGPAAAAPTSVRATEARAGVAVAGP